MHKHLIATLCTLVPLIGCSASPGGPPGGPPGGSRQGGPSGDRPSRAALEACVDQSEGHYCSFTDRSNTKTGQCRAPQDRPLACITEPRRAREPNPLPSYSTAAVGCNVEGSSTNEALGFIATYLWTCAGDERQLKGTGIPDHQVGTFPNAGNPHRVTTRRVSASFPLTAQLTDRSTPVGGPRGASVFAINSVKFDPGTAGTCSSGARNQSDCNLGRGQGEWRIEALGQDVFDFGEDMNNAHVQPTGEYHYHGVPEGILKNAGVTPENPKMQLIGWASDGFPVYGRYCYINPMKPGEGAKACQGSYVLDTVPDAGRPSTSWVPLGAFGSDWSYRAGSGDLDECNGRFGATPEFPDGIYYYMATDTYPYFSRCLRGEVDRVATIGRQRERQRGGRRGGRGGRP